MIKTKLAAKVAQLTSDRVPFVVATVVRARRPTSVRPGDTAVVLTDGTIEGFVGGQCAESSVRLYALRALETGEALLLRLIPGADGGEEHNDGIEGAIVEHNPCLSGGALEIFIEPQLPAPRIMIIGSSPVARALQELSVVAGYEVEATVGAPETDMLGATAVVVASHGNDEQAALTAALSTGVPYVALVASTKRGEAVRDSLDLPVELATQLHTPAGVDIGAESPEEIAISILAELIVVMHTGPGPEQLESEPAAEPHPVVEDSDRERSSKKKDKKGHGNSEHVSTNGHSDMTITNGNSDHIADRLSEEHSYGFAPSLVADTADAPDEGSEVSNEAGTAIDPVCGMKVAASESTQHLDVAGSRVYFCGTGCRVAYASQHGADDGNE
jgi:xanthine dehydrogenase accessory factor